MRALRRHRRLAALIVLAGASLALVPATAHAQRGEGGPAAVRIRMEPGERVPACVTPARLMQHLRERNPRLDPVFSDVARYYKLHGEALRVRWDYAFFQMLIETNYLSYRQGNGRWGDVNPRQFNFAGIGTIGGGVPGDSFKDVSTGVLGQMQHLVAYSGERVANPVAPRTVERQDEIIEKSRALRRPVKFADLARRWAVDWRYARSIEYVAERYRKVHCTAAGEPLRPSPDPAEDAPAVAGHIQAQSPMITEARGACGIWSASYGGQVALLLRSVVGGTTNYTVLQVERAAEAPQAEAFMAAHARNGELLERFESRDAAFARAFELCPNPM